MIGGHTSGPFSQPHLKAYFPQVGDRWLESDIVEQTDPYLLVVQDTVHGFFRLAQGVPSDLLQCASRTDLSETRLPSDKPDRLRA